MEQFIVNEGDVTRVIFGYGAIRFSITGRVLSLIEIKPPVGAGGQILTTDGKKVGEWEDVGRRVDIVFTTFSELSECSNWLDHVEAGNVRSFMFKDVIFDYTTFHESGLTLMRQGLEYVRIGLCMLSAC